MVETIEGDEDSEDDGLRVWLKLPFRQMKVPKKIMTIMFLMDNLCTHPFIIEKQKVTGACTARISASTEQMNALQKLYTGRLTGGVKLC